MNTKCIIFLLLTGTVIILSFMGSYIPGQISDENTDNLFLFQNGIETIINTENAEIEIEKKEFAIRFYNKQYSTSPRKFYVAQIAAVLDKAEINEIRTGMLKSDIPCFEPGTGMASGESGYESLIFSSDAHHYLYYENEEHKRLNLIDESGDLMKLEFEINSLYHDGTEVKMTETELKEFYLAVLIDRNLNEKIETGELYKLTIKIK